MTRQAVIRLLAQYAAYHRDRRNIRTHFVGIPLIWLAVASLLSRPYCSALGIHWSPMLLAGVLLCVYYLKLHRCLGRLMLAVMLFTYGFAACVAQSSTETWLGVSLGMFAAGWIIQFVGHYYEGRKPAFFDDIRGLIIGPLFVLAEACFACGALLPLKQQIEKIAGPLR